MTDKHPKRPRDLKGPLRRLRHNTAQMACATFQMARLARTANRWRYSRVKLSTPI
jgi:hypothetical protein